MLGQTEKVHDNPAANVQQSLLHCDNQVYRRMKTSTTSIIFTLQLTFKINENWANNFGAIITGHLWVLK